MLPTNLLQARPDPCSRHVLVASPQRSWAPGETRRNPALREGSHCIFALLKHTATSVHNVACAGPPPVQSLDLPHAQAPATTKRLRCEGLAAWLRVRQSTISMSAALCHTQSGYYSGAASKRFRKGQRPMVALRRSSQFEEVEALRCALRDAA